MKSNKSVITPSGLSFSFIGPPLSDGPLPAIFYFALSAEESLFQDPYNQPAAYLSSLPIRIFSVDLPGHGVNLPATEALSIWAQDCTCITRFIDQIYTSIAYFMQQNILIPDKIGCMGLSRGGLIATHVAAQFAQIQFILGFAPLTQLSSIKEFKALEDTPLVQSFNLKHLCEKLTDRHLRFYIGNVDSRVGTRLCFDFIDHLSQQCLAKKIRSPQVELIITPSIGYQGHGTSKETFHQGAQWMAEKLKVNSGM